MPLTVFSTEVLWSNGNGKETVVLMKNIKPPLGLLKSQVNLFYENRTYATASNEVLPYFHRGKLKITEVDTITAFWQKDF